MHDEEMVSKNEAEANDQAGSPVSPLDQTDEINAGNCAEGESFDTDPAVSDDSLPDSDPAAAESFEENSENELEQLRSELNRLQNDLEERDAAWKRICLECEEFFALYPDTPLSAVPDGVWEDVKKGVPIAAAFALAQRKRKLTAQKAMAFNQANDLRSSGALHATDPDYFSPAEVRAMSQSEVRANYQKIMKSMQKWN
ncbi:MAG: hypothetical protein IJF33_05220 [Clostridia bacterium]|nr:hypothetical protein [Clostridia bacterium]